jgi:hypothetical protein
MRERTKDPLREVFEREVESLAAEAAKDSPTLPAERIEALAHLARLVEFRSSSRQKSRNWWAALVFVGTLAIVSVLLFARVPTTDIELELSLAEFSFVLAKDQALTGTMGLSALGASGLGRIQTPESRGPFLEQSQAPGDSATAVSVTPFSRGTRQGSLTLAPVPLPAGARVTVQRPDLPNQCRLSTTVPGLIIEATVNGPVTVGLAGSLAREFDFAIPRPVRLETGAEDLALDLTFAKMPQSPFSPQLQVRDLSFSRIDQFLGPDRTLVKRLSTILSGTLYFESLNGQERRLRAGEELRFERSQGEIRTIELADHHIALKFHGRVSGMTTGAGEGHRSIMPTYLEWLWARHGLSLLWGTSLYVFGLIAGALRWWGVQI